MIVVVRPDHYSGDPGYELLMVVICLGVSFQCSWQSIRKSAIKKDTTIILISDLHVQLECSQALNDLYNFKFPQAERQFAYLKQNFRGIRFLIF